MDRWVQVVAVAAAGILFVLLFSGERLDIGDHPPETRVVLGTDRRADLLGSGISEQGGHQLVGAHAHGTVDLPRRDPVAVVCKGALPRDDVEVVGVHQRAVDVQHNAAIRRHRLQLPAPSGRKQLAGALGRVVSTRPRARRG